MASHEWHRHTLAPASHMTTKEGQKPDLIDTLESPRIRQRVSDRHPQLGGSECSDHKPWNVEPAEA